jgi:predicted PurR-regulated permease PerM
LEHARANIRRAYESGRASVQGARAAPDDEDGLITELAGDRPARPEVHFTNLSSHDDLLVPRGVRLAGAWAWRVLVIGGAVLALLWILARISHVVIPLAIALLLSALMAPAAAFLRDRLHLNRSLAAGLIVFTGIIAVVGVLTLVITQFVDGFPQVRDNALDGLRKLQGWLKTGPLHLSDKQLNSIGQSAQDWLDNHRSSLTSGALSTASTVFDVLAGLFLVLFSTFFFVRDGRRIWRFMVNLMPARAREGLASAGDAAWQTLVSYVRATVLVAFIDAAGIGLALGILRVPFAIPLTALVFLGAFIPIVGATLSGAVAVLVALIKSPLTALLVLVAVIAVQQLEGHVLQPLIMGRAVAIHPLAVITAIATGVVIAGITGALVAVPLVAVLNTAVRHLAARRRGEPPPDDTRPVVVSAG